MSWDLLIEVNRARGRLHQFINDRAAKQGKWLRAAIITRNRSLGQRFRYLTRSKT